MGEWVGLTGWGSLEREKENHGVIGKFNFESMPGPWQILLLKAASDMVQVSLKLSLEKPQGCRKYSLSGNFTFFWSVPIGKNVSLSPQCKLVLFQMRSPLLLILPPCTAVESLAPSSQHARCRPAAKICSGPLPGHLSTEKPHPFYSDSLYACTIGKTWSFAACLAPGPLLTAALVRLTLRMKELA